MVSVNVFVSLPLRLVSEANVRQHWAQRSKRARENRGVVKMVVAAALARSALKAPWFVTVTRLGPRTLDTDNLAGSCKHVQDGIADALGCDDGDKKRVSWRYEQRKSPTYGVEVKIEPRR